MPVEEDQGLWSELAQAGQVTLRELPGSPAALIAAAEDPAQRAGLHVLLRRLAELDDDSSRAALERWAGGDDAELAEAAVRHLGGIPLPEWVERILVRFARTPGHPRRYESMLLLNALSRERPLFEEALSDPEPRIRSAGYAGLVIHGRLEHLTRLAEGLNDPTPEVRDYVIELWVEALAGSDVDRRPPLLERSWSAEERAAVEVLRQRLIQRFTRLLDAASGEVRERVTAALALLNWDGRG